MDEDKVFEVALAKEICPVCAKTEDGPIIMNTKLTKSEARKVKALHGKVLDYMKEPCQDCKDMMAQGFVLIGAVEKKTVDNTAPYRSGNIYCVKWSVAEEIFKPNPPPKSGVAFVDVSILVQMEFPDVNVNA